METVKEFPSTLSASTSALEQERMRMQAAVHKATTGDQLRVNRRPNASGAGVARRTPARAASLRPTAPTKSNDALASVRGNAVARANSSRALLRATSSGNIIGRGVARNTSAASQGIRPYSRDQIVNTSIHRANSNDSMKLLARCGPGGSTLERAISELSLGDFSYSTAADNSILTMDSVNLRKTQMVADPLENEGTYDEDDSFADHESFVTRDSDATFFRQHAQQNNTVLTFDDLEAMRMRERLHISVEESSHFSFGTMGSGLTYDYTDDHEESEFVHDETEHAE